jgi:8-oxo-dGTP diphosphatase
MEEPTQEHGSSSTPAVDIYAAGGLIYRDTSGKEIPEILLIHRPDRDWSFPKGKQDLGETLLQTALREVKEETGLTCFAEELIGRVSYLVGEKKLKKEVTYWAMTIELGEFAPNSEVNKIQWATVEEAKELLTWDRDQDFLNTFMNWYEKRAEKGIFENEISSTAVNTDSVVQETVELDSDLEKIESNLAIIESAMNRVADGDLDAAEDLISGLQK